jgi:hypothetical protein
MAGFVCSKKRTTMYEQRYARELALAVLAFWQGNYVASHMKKFGFFSRSVSVTSHSYRAGTRVPLN